MGKKDYPYAYKNGYDRGKRGGPQESLLEVIFNSAAEREAAKEGYYDAIRDKVRDKHMTKKCK